MAAIGEIVIVAKINGAGEPIQYSSGTPTGIGLGTAALHADSEYVHIAGAETITGAKTFSSLVTGTLTSNGATTDNVQLRNAGSGASTRAGASFWASGTRYGGINGGVDASGQRIVAIDVNGTQRLAVTDTGLNATAIGATTPSTGEFTTLKNSGAYVHNDAGVDADWRAEGDNDQNLLFLDASADRVGVGTSTPGTKLHVVGPIASPRWVRDCAYFHDAGTSSYFTIKTKIPFNGYQVPGMVRVRGYAYTSGVDYDFTVTWYEYPNNSILFCKFHSQLGKLAPSRVRIATWNDSGTTRIALEIANEGNYWTSFTCDAYVHQGSMTVSMADGWTTASGAFDGSYSNITTASASGHAIQHQSGNVSIGNTTDDEKLRVTGNIKVDTGRLYGTNLHNHASGMTGTTNQYVGSGTSTPTATNISNVTASTAQGQQYIRVGNVVTVSGEVYVNPTAASTITTIALSLPIASNLANVREASGVGVWNFRAPVAIYGATASDRIQLTFVPASTGNQPLYYTYTYVVL